MNRILIGLLALTLAFFVSSPAALAVGDDTHDDHHVIKGKIVSISGDAHTFLLAGKNHDHKVTVKVTDKTKIRVNGHAAKFGDLEVGMHARVRGMFHKNDQGKKVFLALRVIAHGGDGA